MRDGRGVGSIRVRVGREGLADRVLAGAIGVVAFVALTALGAFVRIPLPFTPVPITLQTLFVHLAGATLGPALGPLSQASYVLLGTVGFPVFAGGEGGWLYLWQGATAGYLVGFVAATWVVGRLVRRRESPGFLWIAGSMACGSLVIYAIGVAWLAWYLVAAKGLALHAAVPAAVAKGMLPFLPGDILKTAAAAGLYRGYRRKAQQFFPA